MPKSLQKASKSPSKRSKTPSKSKSLNETRISTPLSDASNIGLPPTTPRVVDFTLPLNDTGDGWSSDDSFEEKITWSRHRMRTTPGGFTPRNIQEVRRRLNLSQLPEDNSPSARPIALKHRHNVERPSTPVKSFMAKDPSVLPPTPSPKKTPCTPARGMVRTPSKPVKQVVRTQTLVATQGAKIVRSTSPLRPTVTQVKEFKFASEARSRRVTVSPEKVRKESPQKQNMKASASSHNVVPSSQSKRARVEDQVDINQAVAAGNGDGDDGVLARVKAQELGKASILAWGETRGRYLDE